MTTGLRVRRAGAVAIVLALCAAAASIPAAAAATRSVPKCSAADLSAKQTGEGAGMSQPVVMITVTNISGHSCKLNGYPTITSGSTKKGRQAISVGRGDLMNAPDAGPKRIVLANGGQAWFAIGAATAYDPPLVNFIRVRFATAPGGSTISARISLQATAPTGKPFPLGVTAFAPGVGKSS